MTPSEKLRTLIQDYSLRFETLTEKEWSYKPRPEKWSKKEILGHLCDSAMSNIRRFVVTQYQQNQKIVYDPDEWVACQGYQQAAASEVIAFWKLLNLQAARTMELIPAEKLARTCDTGQESEALNSLAFLVDDYIVHMEHHLRQIAV